MADEIDLKIIKMISTDASASNGEMARRLGLTEGAVRRRVKNLAGENIVVDYRARIRYQLLGRTRMIIGLEISPESFNAAIEKIKSLKEASEAYITSGDHSLIFMADTPSQEVSKFLDRVKGIKGVKNVYPSLVQEVLK